MKAEDRPPADFCFASLVLNAGEEEEKQQTSSSSSHHRQRQQAQTRQRQQRLAALTEKQRTHWTLPQQPVTGSAQPEREQADGSAASASTFTRVIGGVDGSAPPACLLPASHRFFSLSDASLPQSERFQRLEREARGRRDFNLLTGAAAQSSASLTV